MCAPLLSRRNGLSRVWIGKAHGVKEEVGDPDGGGSSSASGSGKGKASAATTATTTEAASGLPPDDVAFDQGLRRMRPGKIGKVQW